MSTLNGTVDYYNTQGNKQPPITSTLTDSNGNAVDLSTAVGVIFVAASIKDLDTPVINGAASIVGSPSNGKVQYLLTTQDISVLLETYWAQWIVTFSGGSTQAFPQGGSPNPAYDVLYFQPSLLG